MKTLTINITEKEFLKFGFESENVNFEEFVRKIKIEIAKEAMIKCQSIAEKVGLSNLTLDEIDAEIKAIRNAKGNN